MLKAMISLATRDCAAMHESLHASELTGLLLQSEAEIHITYIDCYTTDSNN